MVRREPRRGGGRAVSGIVACAIVLATFAGVLVVERLAEGRDERQASR